MQGRHLIILGIAILIGLATTAGFLLATQKHTFQGSYIQEPVPAPDFNLTAEAGTAYKLSEQKGKIVLLFFGYTHCPDVCPVTLSDFGKIKEKLGNDADRVEFVFITTDPRRDTPEQVNRYLTNFAPEIQGLTGKELDLEKVWNDYGVYREIAGESGSDDYLVDHSSRVYLIDQSGNLRLTYTFGTESEAIAGDVAYLLKQN